jgi:flagellar biosynthesis protein FlhF
LMLSKLDESTQPWALLQFLTDKSLSVSVASHGDRTIDLVQDVSLAGLVQCALDNLPLPETEEQTQAKVQLSEREAAVNELATSKLAQIASKFKTETTGLTHE